LLALCQFLPGPASSQLGFSLGLIRAGWPGAIAAFIGFTLPSVVLLILFAQALPLLTGSMGLAVVDGLKLVAVAVVADAVLGMARKLCPDDLRKSIAMFTMVFLLLFTGLWAQLTVVAAGAVVGVLLLGQKTVATNTDIEIGISHRFGMLLGVVFVLLLFGLPLVSLSVGPEGALADAFFRAGALVFGGGHVVLPLLQDSMVGSGWVSQADFLAGYGASQAIPGPMFAFSAYLGALVSDEMSIWFALIAVVFMFLPGFLLVSAVLPFWQSVAQHPKAVGAIAGVNAVVVGLLAAALYQPVFTTAVNSAQDMAIALLGFAMLAVWRLSALYVVLFSVAMSVAFSLLGYT
jgi:chromate transporter